MGGIVCRLRMGREMWYRIEGVLLFLLCCVVAVIFMLLCVYPAVK